MLFRRYICIHLHTFIGIKFRVFFLAAIEENMLSDLDSVVQLYLKANETVHIPFKLQCFTAEGATPELVSYLLSFICHLLFFS